MKGIIIRTGIVMLALAPIFIGGQNVRAQSLYEFYSNTPRAELKKETREMGGRLQNTFDQKEIVARQRDIDFADYYAGLKKLIFYGTKLATYADYEQDLTFARDKEIFKGLPDKAGKEKGKDEAAGRREFVQEKYQKMKTNVEEEVATYRDLLQLSLDSCQAIANNGFYNMTEVEKYRDRVQGLLDSREYKDYMAKQEQLADRWGGMAADIEDQLNLWRRQPFSPEAPILDPAVVAAIF